MVARARRSYIAAFPETARNAIGLTARRTTRTMPFVEVSAEVMGVQSRSVSRAGFVGDRLTEMAYQFLLGSRFENNMQRLCEVAELDPVVQGAVCYVLMMGEADTVPEALEMLQQRKVKNDG